MSTDMDLLSRLLEAEKNFKHTRFERVVAEAMTAFEAGKPVCRHFNKLPTKAELLRELIESLKGKSVYKTLRLINEGKSVEKELELKGLSSLFTHIVIECQRGRKEFRQLLPLVYERIGVLIYTLS